MARPKKPTAHLELVGAFKKNPNRARDTEPVCNAPVIIPPQLSENGKKAWDFIVGNAVPGVLTAMDSAYLGLCAESLAHCWWGEKVTITDRRTVGAMLGKMGMTPSERSGVVVPKKEDSTGLSFKDLARKV